MILLLHVQIPTKYFRKAGCQLQRALAEEKIRAAATILCLFCNTAFSHTNTDTKSLKICTHIAFQQCVHHSKTGQTQDLCTKSYSQITLFAKQVYEEKTQKPPYEPSCHLAARKKACRRFYFFLILIFYIITRLSIFSRVSILFFFSFFFLFSI